MNNNPHYSLGGTSTFGIGNARPAGYWWIVPQVNGRNGFAVALHGKPKWRTRVLMQVFFGWEWSDLPAGEHPADACATVCGAKP